MTFRLFLVTLLLCVVDSGAVAAWNDARLQQPVVINGNPVPYREFAIYVLPSATIDVAIAGGNPGRVGYLDRDTVIGTGKLTAPDRPGLDAMIVVNATTGEEARINVFTMVPANRVGADGRLNGYRIGSYPSEPLRGQPIYLPPKGYIEVTADNVGTRLSPNFTLGQFVSKQASDYPKYVVLRAALMLKLENILRELNESGRNVDSLFVMSGYRTPFYNRAIGNVQYSRHVYGGAADIYIDVAPKDGVMDDMNGDGRVDRRDAQWFADFIDRMSRDGKFGPRIGGIGIYRANAAHGPFVHVDVRGSRARW
jgi:hypothetical protein